MAYIRTVHIKDMKTTEYHLKDPPHNNHKFCDNKVIHSPLCVPPIQGEGKLQMETPFNLFKSRCRQFARDANN